jgi:hypothetical protein
MMVRTFVEIEGRLGRVSKHLLLLFTYRYGVLVPVVILRSLVLRLDRLLLWMFILMSSWILIEEVILAYVIV